MQLWKGQQPNFILCLCLSRLNCCSLQSTHPLALRPIYSSGGFWRPLKAFWLRVWKRSTSKVMYQNSWKLTSSSKPCLALPVFHKPAANKEAALGSLSCRPLQEEILCRTFSLGVKKKTGNETAFSDSSCLWNLKIKPTHFFIYWDQVPSLVVVSSTCKDLFY